MSIPKQLDLDKKSSLDIYILHCLLRKFIAQDFWYFLGPNIETSGSVWISRVVVGHGFYKLYLYKRSAPNASILSKRFLNNKHENEWMHCPWLVSKTKPEPWTCFCFLVGGLNRTQQHSRKSKIGSSSVLCKNSQKYFLLARNCWQPPPSNNFDTQPRQPPGTFQNNICGKQVKKCTRTLCKNCVRFLKDVVGARGESPQKTHWKEYFLWRIWRLVARHDL